MKVFAGVTLDNIDSLNLSMLRYLQKSLENVVTMRLDTLTPDSPVCKELADLRQARVVENLHKYIQLKQHERIVNSATLYENSTAPNLFELMQLAKQYQPDDWRIKARLDADCTLLQEYMSLKSGGVDSSVESVYLTCIVGRSNEADLTATWQTQLRKHYLDAMHANFKQSSTNIANIKKLPNTITYPENLAFAYALQMIHLIGILDYLFNNMHSDRDLNELCVQCIYILDMALTNLKCLPEMAVVLPAEPGCCVWVPEWLASTKQKEEMYTIQNFRRFKMLQENPEAI